MDYNELNKEIYEKSLCPLEAMKFRPDLFPEIKSFKTEKGECIRDNEIFKECTKYGYKEFCWIRYHSEEKRLKSEDKDGN